MYYIPIYSVRSEEMTEVSRCTGHCCEDFTLPFGPEEIRRWKKRIDQDVEDIVFENYLGEKGRYDLESSDLPMILNMVQFKRMDSQNINGRGLKSLRSQPSYNKGPRLYHYTCNNYDSEKQLCIAYETRPEMCRSFPDNGPCHYKQCTRKCQQE